MSEFAIVMRCTVSLVCAYLIYWIIAELIRQWKERHQ
jgi:hypothetical protein